MRLSIFAMSALFALVGCSSNSTTNDAGSDSSAPSDGGGSDSSAAPSCQAYCNTVMANCTSTTDPDSGLPVGQQQYTDLNNCLNSCKAMPVGTTADTSGNTLGCRTYHANAAKADPTTHCVHAGPGGNGACGNDCDGFCQIAMMYCTAANNAAVYASLQDCQTQCAKFPDTVKFNIGVQDGNSVACLLYHVQEASSVPPDHCLGDIIADDAGDLSTTCH
jgi:hypothetical protein